MVEQRAIKVATLVGKEIAEKETCKIIGQLLPLGGIQYAGHGTEIRTRL